MRAIVVTRNGGPDVLELRAVPEPEPADGRLLVDVEAIGVNYRDVYEREGRGAYANSPPLIAGVEGAGTAVGSGERVAWVAAPGSYAERVSVPADAAVPVPDGVSTELAAAVLLQGMTAHYLCTSTYAVREGDDVLVHAAAGGVGLLLTQMVKLRGGRVIATTSSSEKAELARAAGADETIGYDGVVERVRELTGGERRRGRLRRRRRRHVRGQPRRAAPARHARPLRTGERARAAVRPRAAARRVSVRDQTGPTGLHGHARGAAGAR